ncbi:hypothetical protein JAO73_10505 [Hymenobacter sp. BT523]|uniref:hypothetical protein n=1 Tax=Hymenobacter sp. BT523 TaxID=2795725 RepID=UPI0018EC8F53|nr:hypothetical protein [Hymenobacter sp. BT523]MBJ6109446.1 hypothetical protein [Hymenobacter sp. BT523]
MLRPEVAALFALTSHVTQLHVLRLNRDVDLTQISVAEAEELLALPGGFEWLKRKEVPANEAGPVADTTGPARAKKKTRARGGV